jgi:hypothetical protein
MTWSRPDGSSATRKSDFLAQTVGSIAWMAEAAGSAPNWSALSCSLHWKGRGW